MKRKFTTYPVNNFKEIKLQMLNWLKRFNIFCFLDNNQYRQFESSFECLIGAGSLSTYSFPPGKELDVLNSFQNAGDWIFGHISYDLKNKIENLSSENYDGTKFPEICFFVPEILLMLNETELKIGCLNGNGDTIFKEILSEKNRDIKKNIASEPRARFSKEEYLSAVRQIKDHIQHGDCYELNFCQEFYINNISIDPFQIFNQLGKFSPSPFSAFYKVNDKYLLSASPERYLHKKGKEIFSQPIKGTAERDLTSEASDLKNKEALLLNEKERAENVMIVDLVRNDLSKICKENSVKVKELFGIYSFPQVHQMISTISGIVRDDANFGDIIKATFPMGSMTGAPKKKVMELIEKYERTKRGLFSGTLGYITPEGDFDFNVIIRSILYNETSKYLSIQAGSAITYNSDPLSEYNECLLKAAALKKALN